MWIFAQRGFVSIVAHEDDAAALHVRARFEGDIERLFPGARVETTPLSDYLYRTTIDRDVVARALAAHVRQIGYRNYKATIAEPRHSWYFEVWLVLVEAQGALAPKAVRTRPRLARVGR